MRRVFTIVFLTAMLGSCGGAQAHHVEPAKVGRELVRLDFHKASIVISATASPSPSLASQIANAANGTVIHLASGNYGQINDYAARTGWVTISGQGDATPPQIDGADLFGGQYVRFVDVTFTNQVYINRSPYPSSTQLASNIQILDSEVNCGSTTTSPLTTGIFVRGASSNVTIEGDYIHNCVQGFLSQAQDPLSHNILIVGNQFSDFPGDAIDLGGLEDVTISHNLIQNISDPAGQWHDDGIQFFGNVHNVDITDNVLSNSRDQLIFIQDAIEGADGSRSNTNILIAHNLVYGAGAVAVQDQGGINVHFIGNTMWDNYYGSLWVRSSTVTGREPQNTVITDNIIQGLEFLDGATTINESYNLIANGPTLYKDGANGIVYIYPVASNYVYGQGDLVNVNPDFVNEPAGDFQLMPGSPAIGAGTSSNYAFRDSPTTSLSFGPTMNDLGAPIGPSVTLGAFQPADTSVSYGAPDTQSQWPLHLSQ